MIEVARAILNCVVATMKSFNDLVSNQNLFEKSNSENPRNSTIVFILSLNVDRLYSAGDNKWGLRSWYAIDEVDEEIILLERDWWRR